MDHSNHQNHQNSSSSHKESEEDGNQNYGNEKCDFDDERIENQSEFINSLGRMKMKRDRNILVICSLSSFFSLCVFSYISFLCSLKKA